MKCEMLAVLAVIAVSGCATSETVYLRNATGQTVKCGPTRMLPLASLARQAAVISGYLGPSAVGCLISLL